FSIDVRARRVVRPGADGGADDDFFSFVHGGADVQEMARQDSGDRRGSGRLPASAVARAAPRADQGLRHDAIGVVFRDAAGRRASRLARTASFPRQSRPPSPNNDVHGTPKTTAPPEWAARRFALWPPCGDPEFVQPAASPGPDSG